MFIEKKRFIYRERRVAMGSSLGGGGGRTFRSYDAMSATLAKSPDITRPTNGVWYTSMKVHIGYGRSPLMEFVMTPKGKSEASITRHILMAAC